VSAALQPEAWRRLTRLLERLPHALLLHGPAGVGKLALAERFAQLLLCEGRGGATEPCGKCDGCRWFASGNHPDVRLVEPEALARYAELPEDEEEGERPRRKSKPSLEIKIEQVRALADFVYVGSHRGGRRVAILHPADDLNLPAANALLKSLEEPPPAAVFLLVSHRPARLPATVRSRCVPVPIPVPPAAGAARWLGAQGVRDPERWLSYCGGAPRLALELASGERGEIVEEILAALSSGDRAAPPGLTDRPRLEAFAEALQKMALDRAFQALSGRPKYLPPAPGPAGASPKEWLAFARLMGRNRALARHPLNPRLFATEMLDAMPTSNEN